jgi:hypothetical protein
MEQDKNKNNIPDQDPSKAMDSRREVAQSNDEKTDQDFPGYPHYPAKEDIMDQRTDSHRVDLDVENIPSNRNMTGVNQRFKQVQGETQESGQDDLSLQDSRNEEIGKPQNISNEDLANQNDLPGSEQTGNER